MARQDPKQGRNWYVIHTYSGYEDAVAKDLLQRIESMGMQDFIFDVLVPKETQYVVKKGETTEEKKKLFPGYVFVDMTVTDESWYVVRNTPNVTGFVGAGSIPIPVSADEFGLIQKRTSDEAPEYKSDFEVGEMVQLVEGPFTGYKGIVDTVQKDKGRLKILVNVFNRETPVEVEFNQVKKDA